MTTPYKVGKCGYSHFITEASRGRIKALIPLISVHVLSSKHVGRPVYLSGRAFSSKVKDICFLQNFLSEWKISTSELGFGSGILSSGFVLHTSAPLSNKLTNTVFYYLLQ